MLTKRYQDFRFEKWIIGQYLWRYLQLMRFYFLAIAFLLLLPINYLGAQTTLSNREQRILLLLDGSISMQQNWGSGKTRFNAASRIITLLMDSLYTVNDQVAFGLRVYGNQYPAAENNCFDTRLEVLFSKDNRTQMNFRMENLHPMGVSPVSFALNDASENELNEPQLYSYNVIIITSGGESCGGNICSVVNEMMKSKTIFVTYVVSLADNPSLRQQYGCVGDFLPVADEHDITATVTKIVNEYRKSLPKQNIPYQPTTHSPLPKPISPKESSAQPISISAKYNDTVHQIIPPQSKAVPTVTISLASESKESSAKKTNFEGDSVGSYLLFTSKLKIKKVSVQYLNDGKFQPVDNSAIFKLPMIYKIIMNSGRYRVVYLVDDGNSIEVEKSKEFYVRSKMNNTVDLD